MHKKLKILHEYLKANSFDGEAEQVLKIAVTTEELLGRGYTRSRQGLNCCDKEFKYHGNNWEMLCDGEHYNYRLLDFRGAGEWIARHDSLKGSNKKDAWDSLDRYRKTNLECADLSAPEPKPGPDVRGYGPASGSTPSSYELSGSPLGPAEDIISDDSAPPPISRRQPPRSRRSEFEMIPSSDENTKNIILLNIPGSQGGTSVAIVDGGEKLWRSLIVNSALPNRKPFYVLITENRECYRSERSTLFMIGEDTAGDGLFHVSSKFIDLVPGSRNALKRHLEGLDEVSGGNVSLMSHRDMIDKIYSTTRDVRKPIRSLPFFERIKCMREQKLNRKVRERARSG